MTHKPAISSMVVREGASRHRPLSWIQDSMVWQPHGSDEDPAAILLHSPCGLEDDDDSRPPGRMTARTAMIIMHWIVLSQRDRSHLLFRNKKGGSRAALQIRMDRAKAVALSHHVHSTHSAH
ncbi:hypothetical protein, partial [Sinorhizobium meliloti]|uniref:hypothetical protein n=1 Tax=Rhizobium meliloti TaxID=382 RepID=UPI000FE135B5